MSSKHITETEFCPSFDFIMLTILMLSVDEYRLVWNHFSCFWFWHSCSCCLLLVMVLRPLSLKTRRRWLLPFRFRQGYACSVLHSCM